MPFITRDQFDKLVPIAAQLVLSDAAFIAAEADAAATASRISGVPIPTNAGDAPAEMHRPVAHLAAFTMSTGAKLTDADAAAVRQMERRAREDLMEMASRRSSAVGDEPDVRTGELDSLPTW